MRTIIFLIISTLFSSLHGQELRVGLLRTINIKSIELNTHEGDYTLYGDSIFESKFTSGSFMPKSSGIKVLLDNGEQHEFSEIKIVSTSSKCSMMVKSTSPASRTHYYEDDFELSSKNNSVQVINIVSMNNYLPGVIESEGGGGRHMEYYKVQALMSRTYALKNIGRHAKEGFNVCDGVHCQAYHNMLRHTPIIRDAVNQTVGEVLADSKNNLVTSYFSANCGGQTCDASYVWNTSVSYLESFVDTFCVHTKQAKWTKEIDKSVWCSFLKKEYGLNCDHSAIHQYAFNFRQDTRKAFYIHPSLGVPLRDLRSKFNLKSTFFDVTLNGTKVVIHGRGFGHGVGLCQEGAMNMAQNGYTYSQIALFYFSNVKILDYYRNQFFKQNQRL